MRPFVLCALIMLLAFEIGSVFVYKRSEKSVAAQTSGEIKAPVSKSVQEMAQDEESDEEEMAFEVLKPTIGKWLRNEKIKSEFTDASDESIKRILGKERSELSRDDILFLNGFRYEPTLIDVDGDGKKELAIRNYCGGVGNCRFRLFKRNEKSYDIILDSEPGAVQRFKLRETKTNDYFDIEATSHGDAWSGDMNVYKFDGKEYKISECYGYNYLYKENGKVYEVEKPIITSRKCSNE